MGESRENFDISEDSLNEQDMSAEEFQKYTERMLEIRMLSSPDIRSFDDADSYSERLTNNFRRIGELAAENRKMLKQKLYPQLESDENPDEQLREDLYDFADTLVTVAGETNDYENLDLPIAAMVSDKLMERAEESGDISELIRQMDEHIAIYYSLSNTIARVTSQPQIFEKFNEKGLEIGYRFLRMLDKDFFLTIPDEESRETVLINARFMTAFYESCCDEESNRKNLEILDRMLEIADDPFYIEAVPDYNWAYNRFRIYEYYMQCTEISNLRGFNKEQLQHICDRSEEMAGFCETDPEYFKIINGYDFFPIHLIRCRYLAGRMEREAYWKELVRVYKNRDKNDLSIDGAYFNIVIPLDLICMLDPGNFTAEEGRLLEEIYTNICAYLFRFPSGGILSYIMGYFTNLIERYVEVPSGISFESFIIQCLAAIHPPTYIHSRMVGQIAERLTYHLLRKSPELFIGSEFGMSVDEITAGRDGIAHYAYHAGLCHDFGKICIIDTIFVYGRNLLDYEFSIIKSHPTIGAELLKKHDSTKRYADVALGHHKWYNDEGGYPGDFKTVDSPVKTIIDIVQCADCMDAATDSVGRSYSRGKTLDEFMEELKKGSSTRYAPWLHELLEDPKVHADVEFLLTEGRQSNYRETYNLLKDVKDREQV
ncbi:MAG: HD domain-containing protein [Lachnospiraceae bacterium]|nr:HD domain-containing protein [Lachnospiraceae bacterium]